MCRILKSVFSYFRHFLQSILLSRGVRKLVNTRCTVSGQVILLFGIERTAGVAHRGDNEVKVGLIV